MNYFSPSARGHSLIEMLSVVSIIGIMAAIAVPTVSQINGASQEARNKRNAQSLAAVFSSAAAAGVEFIDEAQDLSKTVANTSQGGFATGGPFDGSWFGVPLTEEQQKAAEDYLGISNGMLQYFPHGSTQVAELIVFEDQVEFAEGFAEMVVEDPVEVIEVIEVIEFAEDVVE